MHTDSIVSRNCSTQLLLRRSPPRRRLRLRRRRPRCRRRLGPRCRLPGVEVSGAVAGFERAHDDGRRVRLQGVAVRG